MDMNNEYAAALFSLACEQGAELQILDALKRVRGYIVQQPEYLDFLASASIPMQNRLSAVSEAFCSDMPEYVVSFLQILVQHGQIRKCIKHIDAYTQLYNQKNRIIQAQVRSVVPLTQEQIEALCKKLERLSGQKVQLTCVCDDTLLGGMVVYVDGKVLDGSIRHKLSDMKEVMY